MKNWKTTLGGFIGAAGMAMQASDDVKVKVAGAGLCAIALAWFGWHAQDK